MDTRNGIDAAIEAALGRRVVGAVVQVRRQGALVYARAAGLADREAGRAMQADAIFRLASVTKLIVTAAALRMVDLGLLRLEDPVAEYLPYFTPQTPDGKRPPILIHHLLTHMSGLTYDPHPGVSNGLSGPVISLEENLRRLARLPLRFQPGAGWEYGLSIDVLGGVLAAINGSDLAGAVARHVTGPLGMTDTGSAVADRARLAVPYADGSPPHRMAEPESVTNDKAEIIEFSPARILDPSASQSGGAGMAGTVADVMVLLEGLRGNDFLNPATRTAAFANQIGPVARGPDYAGTGFGYLGAVLLDQSAAQSALPRGAVEWGGVYGHFWAIDPATETSIVSCSNTAFEGMSGRFYDEIMQAVFA